MDLIPHRTDRPVLEAILESGEVITDALMRGDVIADIPLIGTAFKICKAGDSIRDQAFAAKLMKFVSALNSVPERTRQQIKDKIASSPTDAAKVGETLLLVIERITDLDKPLLLSYLFLAYIDDVITADELRRFAQVVDASFPDDLRRFLEAKDLPKKSAEPWMQFLAHTGLTGVIAGQTWADSGLVYYEGTSLGNKRRNAYCHGRKKAGYVSGATEQ